MVKSLLTITLILVGTYLSVVDCWSGGRIRTADFDLEDYDDNPNYARFGDFDITEEVNEGVFLELTDIRMQNGVCYIGNSNTSITGYGDGYKDRGREFYRWVQFQRQLFSEKVDACRQRMLDEYDSPLTDNVFYPEIDAKLQIRMHLVRDSLKFKNDAPHSARVYAYSIVTSNDPFCQDIFSNFPELFTRDGVAVSITLRFNLRVNVSPDPGCENPRFYDLNQSNSSSTVEYCIDHFKTDGAGNTVQTGSVYVQPEEPWNEQSPAAAFSRCKDTYKRGDKNSSLNIKINGIDFVSCPNVVYRADVKKDDDGASQPAQVQFFQ